MEHFSNIEKADMHLAYGAANGNAEEALRIYRARYPNRRAPSARHFTRLDQSFRDNGLYSSRVNAGRPRTVRVDREEEVIDTVLANPSISTNQIEALTGVSRSTASRIIIDEGLYPYHYRKAQALQPRDYPARLAFCQWIERERADNQNFGNNILFTDEATFVRGGLFNQHNSHVYAYENPHAIRETHFQQRFQVNVWAGVIGNKLIGPHVFEENLNGNVYHNFLRYTLDNLIEEAEVPLAVYPRMWFQHDGAPPHFSVQVRQYLNQAFPRRWIGRGGPVNWPARSPDLNPLDFYVWGTLKNFVYGVNIQNVEELRERIFLCANDIKEQLANMNGIGNQLMNRVRLCLLQQGGHFEQLL